ncbi:MAG: aspartate aminotransferase family protein [Betaproteobacteria bacterium]
MKPSQSEGDINQSPRRSQWQSQHLEPATRALLARDSAAFLHQSVSTPCLSAIAKAQGIWIEDVGGRRYMDFHGNNVHHVGYAHPHVIGAIKQQLDALTFAPRRFAAERAVQLAEALGQRFETLTGQPGKVLFTTGGSDAVEVAIKLARVATGRFKTLSFWDSFHGAGLGASSVGGESLFRSGQAVGPLLPGAEHVAPFGCYRCPYGHAVDERGQPRLDQCKLACASMLRYVLEREGDVAAVIAEPARAVPFIPPPGYWQAVREACHAHGTLLIFDEIPTGLGKTGRFFAAEHDGAAPDIVVLGKALGGGVLPIAACIARADLDVAGVYALGHYTHEKNPVTAAALATLEVIEREGLVENAARVGEYALQRLQEMQQRHALIGDVRGRGLLLGLDLVSERASKAPAADAAERVLYAALSRGLSFKTTMGNVLTLTPPLITTQTQMGQALDILEKCLGEVGSG